MRVLMVTEDIPAPQVGGLGKHVVTLANALIDQGHEVALMGRSELNYQKFASDIGFRGRFIPGFDLSRSGWKEAQLGIWMPYKRLALAYRIARAIERHAALFDTIHYHGHLPMVGQYLPDSINFVQTRHDQGSECITHLRFRNGAVCDTLNPVDCAGCIHRAPSPLRLAISSNAVLQYRETTRQTFARRKTIFVSDFLRRQFLRAIPHADLHRTHVIHNFIDLARLNRAAERAINVHSGNLLMVGRMDHAKGFGAFLDAISDKLSPSMSITIVGDGPERAAVELRHASPKVQFVGWYPYDEVVRLTRSAHVCVVPSILQESCGTTILEALALGRPCLALRDGGSPELAAYERCPGQLQLADSMEELAALAIQSIQKRPLSMPLAEQFGADVVSTIPKIIEVYMER